MIYSLASQISANHEQVSLFAVGIIHNEGISDLEKLALSESNTGLFNVYFCFVFSGGFLATVLSVALPILATVIMNAVSK